MGSRLRRRLLALLQGDDVVLGLHRLDAPRLLIHCFHMTHDIGPPPWVFPTVKPLGAQCFQKFRFMLSERAVDLETGVGPTSDPLAVVQIRPFS